MEGLILIGLAGIGYLINVNDKNNNQTKTTNLLRFLVKFKFLQFCNFLVHIAIYSYI